MRLAHAAGDELRDLGAEVEDEDFLVLHEAAAVFKKDVAGMSKAKDRCLQ